MTWEYIGTNKKLEELKDLTHLESKGKLARGETKWKSRARKGSSSTGGKRGDRGREKEKLGKGNMASWSSHPA